MRRLIHTRLAPTAVVLLAWVSSLAPHASAQPLELENDASVSWANNPNCIQLPALCNPLIIGAPRLVPDMSDTGDLLLFLLDFHDVSVSNFTMNPSFIGLNIADDGGNALPLQLTHLIPTSSPNVGGSGLLPADDLLVNLGSFNGFNLLPAGDLLFTVTLRLALDLPFGQVFNNDTTHTQAATLTISGPGTVVPEPSTLVLLLAGLVSAGLGTRWRRSLQD